MVRKFKVARLMLAKISIMRIIDGANDLVWPGECLGAEKLAVSVKVFTFTDTSPRKFHSN